MRKGACCAGILAFLVLSWGFLIPKSQGFRLGEEPMELRLAFVTCAVEAKFFDPVKKGMNDAASMLGVRCDFMGTEGVDVEGQVRIFREAIASGYDGIAINIIDPVAFDEVIQEAVAKGIPVVGFNVDDHATPNARLSSVNQQLYKAGQSLADFLSSDIPENAHVLITMHDEGVSALEDRRDGIRDILKKKNVTSTVIIPGNDSAKGVDAIVKVLRKNPRIRIILGTGQADTEAAGMTIEKYFPDKGYWAAGFDLSPKTLQLIKSGHIRCTVDQQPYIQGFYPVVQLTHYLRYGIIPSNVDAGATIIDLSNVDRVVALSEKKIR